MHLLWVTVDSNCYLTGSRPEGYCRKFAELAATGGA